MISRKTVFVLGAGASQPYRYPVGIELTSHILDQMQPGNGMYQTLIQAGFAIEKLDAFRIGFQRSGRFSIDAFLQHRPDHSEVGRAAIAYQIMSREHSNALYSAPPDRDWYRHLVNKMGTAPTEFLKNKVAFITFNYDRSLEYYLVQHLAGSHGLADAAAYEIVSNIPIIHLHGDVGALPWAKAGGRGYSAEIQPHELQQWAKRIHIVHDELAEREEKFLAAERELETAGVIVFLGFSFDEINSRRLDIVNLEKPAFGTALGLTGAEINAIYQRDEHKVQLYDMDSLGLLRNVLLLN